MEESIKWKINTVCYFMEFQKHRIPGQNYGMVVKIFDRKISLILSVRRNWTFIYPTTKKKRKKCHELCVEIIIRQNKIRIIRFTNRNFCIWIKRSLYRTSCDAKSGKTCRAFPKTVYQSDGSAEKNSPFSLYVYYMVSILYTYSCSYIIRARHRYCVFYSTSHHSRIEQNERANKVRAKSNICIYTVCWNESVLVFSSSWHESQGGTRIHLIKYEN